MLLLLLLRNDNDRPTTRRPTSPRYRIDNIVNSCRVDRRQSFPLTQVSRAGHRAPIEITINNIIHSLQ